MNQHRRKSQENLIPLGAADGSAAADLDPVIGEGDGVVHAAYW